MSIDFGLSNKQLLYSREKQPIKLGHSRGTYMAGKDTFDEPSQLERLLVFLTQYQWIWDIKITQLFVSKHFMKIPSEVSLSDKS